MGKLFLNGTADCSCTRILACGRPSLGTLAVRAEELDQDGGNDLGWGVVVVYVEHLEMRTRRGCGLFGDRALEPARAVLAAENEDGRGDLLQLCRGYPTSGDGEIIGERG